MVAKVQILDFKPSSSMSLTAFNGRDGQDMPFLEIFSTRFLYAPLPQISLLFRSSNKELVQSKNAIEIELIELLRVGNLSDFGG